MTALGSASDRAAAEQRLRYYVEDDDIEPADEYPGLYLDTRAVLAELDRQRALIAALLAECEARENDPTKFDLMTTERIRALLEGEKR